jgi:hypothetical protein
MKAEKFFADKHCASLENSLQARLRQQITAGTLNVLNQLPTFVIQLLFLGIGLLLALDQTGGFERGQHRNDSRPLHPGHGAYQRLVQLHGHGFSKLAQH